MTNVVEGTPGRELEVHTSQRYPLGMLMVMNDGRKFRYVKAGASTLVLNNLVQGAAPVTNHLAMTPTAAAVNAREVTVTLGATAATKDQYAGGVLLITTAAYGEAIAIASHPAAASSAALTLTLAQKLLTAIPATASSATLVPSAFSGVIQLPTTKTHQIAGAVVTALTAGQFGWVQTRGLANVLTSGTVVLGSTAMAGGAAGAVTPLSGTGAVTDIAVGTVVRVGATTANSGIYLTLDG